MAALLPFLNVLYCVEPTTQYHAYKQFLFFLKLLNVAKIHCRHRLWYGTVSISFLFQANYFFSVCACQFMWRLLTTGKKLLEVGASSYGG